MLCNKFNLNIKFNAAGFPSLHKTSGPRKASAESFGFGLIILSYTFSTSTPHLKSCIPESSMWQFHSDPVLSIEMNTLLKIV